jgi:hypothetical protein
MPPESSFPPDRYSGKPFLKLVDCWLLRCIGELASDAEAGLEAMTPRLRQTYNHAGQWYEIVRDQLEYPPAVEDAIRQMWAKNQQLAARAGTVLSPVDFVMRFVASNIDGDPAPAAPN